jgi:hypothetical protein
MESYSYRKLTNLLSSFGKKLIFCKIIKKKSCRTDQLLARTLLPTLAEKLDAGSHAHKTSPRRNRGAGCAGAVRGPRVPNYLFSYWVPNSGVLFIICHLKVLVCADVRVDGLVIIKLKLALLVTCLL